MMPGAPEGVVILAPPRIPEAQFSEGKREMDSATGADDLISNNSGRRWQFVRQLRQCLFGDVHLAVEYTLQPDGQRVYRSHAAIKVLELTRIRNRPPNGNEDPLKEVAVMQHLSNAGGHSNVLSLEEVVKDDVAIYLVMPYCDGGELFGVVHMQGKFSETDARPLFKQVLSGMDFLRQMRICHRDMSLENLLVNKRQIVLVIDYGMSLLCPEDPDGYRRALLTPQGTCGKENYIAPEVVLNNAFDGFAVDVWACGIILFIMLTGFPPFTVAHVMDERFQVIAVQRRLGDLVRAWNLSLSPAAVSLIQSCLVNNPFERPAVTSLLNHPWVREESNQIESSTRTPTS